MFARYDKIYETGVRADGKSSVGKLFASYFSWKIENPPFNHRSSKYISGK